MQNWKDLYVELANKLQNDIPELRWIDLWHNQVNFLEEEHPFPTPAVFLQFRIMSTEDHGEKVQAVQLQVDAYVYYETFADTYKGSFNQSSALDFLQFINDVYATLHGTGGDNYSAMRRIGFNPVDTGNAGNLYMISFECTLTDYAAMVDWQESSGNELDLQVGGKPDKALGKDFKIDV